MMDEEYRDDFLLTKWPQIASYAFYDHTYAHDLRMLH